MNKFKNWLIEHRVRIGYTVGILNILSGLSNIFMGNIIPGLFWSAIGAYIVFDVRTYK